MTLVRAPIGLLPAAGRGVRFGASGYSKELFPLIFEGPEEGRFEPRPISELALLAIQAAGARRCIAVVSRDKTELVRVLGPGLTGGLALSYVVQPEPLGLPDVVRCARPWLEDSDTVFAMPDTVFLPGTALAEVNARRVETGADVVLGVFPVDEPERLGPVEMAADGKVLRVWDKPGSTPHNNTWGLASWSPKFTAFCCEWADAQGAASGRELALGHAFEAARESGLEVRGVHFQGGRFLDIGTPRGLRAALRELASHGVLIGDQAATLRATRTP